MFDCVIILRNNTCPHIAMLVTVAFQEYSWDVLNHPPYSSDWSLPDSDLFPEFKELLQGICFSNLSELSSVMTRHLVAQKETALTQNRKAAGTLVSVHFMRRILH